MRAFSTAFSIIVLAALGIYMIAFAANWGTPLDQINNLLKFLGERRVLDGIAGAVFLGLGYLLLHLSLRRFSREPSMAFQNPDGEVRVAFSAIEDFIKRLVGKLKEVREMHPQVLATREGLEIYNRIILEPNTNIPEATRRIQEIIKKYIEDVLGIKDIVAIKVLVVKIAPEEGRRKRGKEEEPILPEVEVGE